MSLIKLKYIFLISIIINSCTDAKNSNDIINELPKDWIQLTKFKGEMLIYNSCDMGNLLLSIYKKNDTNQLLMHGQQEDELFEILESSFVKDTIVIKAKSKITNEKHTFKFIWKDKEKAVGRWLITFSNGYTSNELFVTKQKQDLFKTINQSCVECWGDECTEK